MIVIIESQTHYTTHRFRRPVLPVKMRSGAAAFAPLLLFAAVAFCGSVLAQTARSDYRLPTNVKPSNYHLTVTPYLKAAVGKPQFTFDGIVIITLQTDQTGVNSIVLHQRDLTFGNDQIRLTRENDVTQISVTASHNDTTNKLTLNLSTSLVQNQKYTLRIEYTGLLNNNMYGFYRSSYVENGVTKWAATTQMQPTYARRVLPCFDEPSFKATFDVVINRPTEFQPSVSNGKLSTSTS